MVAPIPERKGARRGPCGQQQALTDSVSPTRLEAAPGAAWTGPQAWRDAGSAETRGPPAAATAPASGVRAAVWEAHEAGKASALRGTKAGGVRRPATAPAAGVRAQNLAGPRFWEGPAGQGCAPE